MTVDVMSLGRTEPFCAGVVLLDQVRRLILTLNTDLTPDETDRPVVRLGGVGGGQEPGESPWECARREAVEEIGVPVRLLAAPRTYLRDAGSGMRVVECADHTPPLLVERRPNPSPDKPFGPGLPVGPDLYVVTFIGMADSAEISPRDVAGIVECPIEQCHRLLDEPTVAEIRRWPGVRVRVTKDVPGTAFVRTPEEESFPHVVTLLREDPAVEQMLLAR
jgi:8-oxo-dGTP pyrophosphatase MutT (NUDIX family)